MFDEQLTKIVKKALIDRNITQKKIADELGISLQLLNGVINGNLQSLSVEIKILDYLNIDDTRTTIR